MTRYSKHVIIVGTARSGTSWISEIIARQTRYRMLFEPEHENRTKRGHLLCDLWIDENNASKEVNNYLKDVFNNRVDCDWIAQNSNRKFKRHLWPFLPKKYIIKFVRANLSAKYINSSFKIPVIHIIRNPYDVIWSQKRANFNWLTDLSHFTKQERLVNLIKNKFDFDISNYEKFTQVEKLALRWCIENVIPIEVLEPYQYDSKIVKYEELINDINVFKRLCEEFDLTPIKNIDDIYRKPSSKTHKNSVIRTKKERVVDFSNEELNQINQMLELFKTQLFPIRKRETIL